MAQVSMTTFDALVGQHGEPGFVKIDVEGYELQVPKELLPPLRALSVEFSPGLKQTAAQYVEYLGIDREVQVQLVSW